jgi:predicted ABC-type ATPase
LKIGKAMPEVIIVAGPNGAGKTSFARQFITRLDRKLSFINADEIARAIPEDVQPQSRRDIEAARSMLRRMGQLVNEQADFGIETTLSALGYLAKIRLWQSLGYRVTLIFLRLPSADHAVERVRRRVSAGGHDIPEDTIRRRFDQGLENLEMLYKPLVDSWYVYDSHEGSYVLVASTRLP